MASHSVICYPQPGKQKSLDILRAFAEGTGARMCRGYVLEGDCAAFYGTMNIERLWHEVLEKQHPYFYLDNSYFDCVRGSQFRVGINALQHTGIGEPNWQRWKSLGLTIKPWRSAGKHVLVVEQSDYFMQNVVRWPHGNIGWQHHVLSALKLSTDRMVVFRHWMRDKRERAATLKQDLHDAWAVVVHTSAAANEALLEGIPVFTTGQCAATAMAGDLKTIEKPLMPDDREHWAAVLAGQQWTLDELRRGMNGN